MSKLSKDELRTGRIPVRVNVNERKVFEDLLSVSSYSTMSSMIRDIVINKRYTVRYVDPQQYEEKRLLLTESKYIGNNFNQMLKSIHSKKLTYFTETEKKGVINYLKSISILLDKINKTVHNDS